MPSSFGNHVHFNWLQQIEPVMSKAGVMTIPRCAKYSEELALATCENTGGRSSGPSFGFGLGIHRGY